MLKCGCSLGEKCSSLKGGNVLGMLEQLGIFTVLEQNLLSSPLQNEVGRLTKSVRATP